MVLPAAFPNLLANGSSGIAVGMATNIPPHNADELCTALLHLIKHPNAHDREARRVHSGAGFPDRRHAGGAAREHHRGLPHGARRLPSAGALGEGGYRPRRLSDRRHRDALSGAEGEADREDRRAADREEAAAARRRARRERGGHPPRPRAQEPHRRSRGADGEPVPPDRAGNALRPQHERAVGGADPQRACACATCCGSGWSTASRCWCAAPSSGCKDRAPAGSARRLSDRLPQYRRSDPHRPLRGRAEGQADRPLQAHRRAGRSDPRTCACGRCRGSRRWRSGPSTTSCRKSGAI